MFTLLSLSDVDHSNSLEYFCGDLLSVDYAHFLFSSDFAIKKQAFLFIAGGETYQMIRGMPLRLAQAYILVNARG